MAPEQVTRSGQISRPAERLQYVHMAEVMEHTKDSIPGEIFLMEAIYMDSHIEDMEPMAMKASVDPDTMYLHEAMN